MHHTSLPPIMAKVPTQSVSLDVAFLPGARGADATPSVYTHVFREESSAHTIEYLDMVTQIGQSVFKMPEPLDGDMFQAIRAGLSAGKRLADGNMGLLKHITRIDDEEWLNHLLPSQQEALVAGYEACNAAVTEYKKKLVPLYHEATKLLAARATELMLQRYGGAKPTE